MLGSLLAGTEESPGAMEIYQGRSFKVYRGMGSMGAMAEGSKTATSRRMPRSWCPRAWKGACPTRDRCPTPFSSWVGGLRAGMGYCGTATIEALCNESEFIHITGAGLTESHPHDIYITKEAPNYSRQTGE